MLQFAIVSSKWAVAEYTGRPDGNWKWLKLSSLSWLVSIFTKTETKWLVRKQGWKLMYEEHSWVLNSRCDDLMRKLGCKLRAVGENAMKIKQQRWTTIKTKLCMHCSISGQKLRGRTYYKTVMFLTARRTTKNNNSHIDNWFITMYWTTAEALSSVFHAKVFIFTKVCS